MAYFPNHTRHSTGNTNQQIYGTFMLIKQPHADAQRVKGHGLTCGIPSQSSASCMASVAFSTGFSESQISQSGHRP